MTVLYVCLLLGFVNMNDKKMIFSICAPPQKKTCDVNQTDVKNSSS